MNEEPENTELIRVAFVGDVGVGKTCMLYQLFSNVFKDDIQSTYGVEFAPIIVKLENGKTIDIQICDAGGGQSSRAMVLSILKTCPMVVIVYDITNPASFDHIEEWVQYAKEKAGSDVLVSIVGNKVDLATRRVPTEEGEILAKKYGAIFDEVSAKQGTNMQAFIRKVGAILLDHFPPSA